MAGVPTSLHCRSSWHSNPTQLQQEKENIAEFLKLYLSGEPVYIQITSDPKRVNAIAQFKMDDDTIQDLLHGEHDQTRWYGRRDSTRQRIEPKPENVDVEKMGKVNISGYAIWDGRKNRVNYLSAWNIMWLKGHEGGTVWSYETPAVEKVDAVDKLGREIKVGDFISYILYHFDGGGAAGIYYGKVTKITKDGNVYAKNIKLAEDDRVDEKRIKDNDLIVVMTKDLMDRLMLARLSIL